MDWSLLWLALTAIATVVGSFVAVITFMYDLREKLASARSQFDNAGSDAPQSSEIGEFQDHTHKTRIVTSIGLFLMGMLMAIFLFYTTQRVESLGYYEMPRASLQGRDVHWVIERNSVAIWPLTNGIQWVAVNFTIEKPGQHPYVKTDLEKGANEGFTSIPQYATKAIVYYSTPSGPSASSFPVKIPNDE